jgi:penicillin amidase
MTRPTLSLRTCLIALPCVLVLALLAALATGWLALRASLPQLDGSRAAATLSAPVSIERDAAGVPTLRGRNRLDVAYATGFAHGQDRFFQMDLLRRVAAGEVSALIGPAALPLDRLDRPHRFRERARALFASLPADQRELVERYTAGVNDALASLGSRPFEYWVLRTPPVAWRPEDTLLVVYAMYFDLQQQEVRHILSRAALRDSVPADLFAFLLPAASHWDAPFDLAGPAQPASGMQPALPASRPDWLRAAKTAQADPSWEPWDNSSAIGSNGWVVDGAHGVHGPHDPYGGAILASDMHLGLALPNIWYRLSLQWPGPDGRMRRVTGVSLPGAPLVVAGSNGQVAWGFTDSYGRFIDLIELQRNPADPLRYRTASGGWERASITHERIEVNGAAPVDLPVTDTRWGPEIVSGSHTYALRWVAHDREAVNLNLQRLEDSTSVKEALHVAQTSGIPTQNFMAADAQGSIGWTLAGPLPRREAGAQDRDAPGGPPNDLPFDSASYRGWRDYLAPNAYPSRIDPPLGRLWTANNRTLPASEEPLVGDAGADLGARASQIRDDLLALPRADERHMLAIQTDDRALWIGEWRRVALAALDSAALEDHPQRAQFRRLVETWNGRADAGSIGYRLLRAFYFSLYDAWFGKLDTRLAARDPQLGFRAAGTRYDAVMEALAARRAWVPDGFADWRAFMLDRIDQAIRDLPQGTTLDDAHWGDRNRAAIGHPFARIVPSWLPWVRGWLAAPAEPLPGDFNMPRVQAPSFGASERMVVSPGREQDGIFDMPGGQSGHPLSPYFLAGHEAWVRGDATPFLPGATVHTLVLAPQSAR